MSFFEPSPVLYAFLFVQSFLYAPVIALLALTRLAVGHGPSRLWALTAAALALGAMFLQFGPATRVAGGMALPLAPSLALAVSALVRGRRWRGIDWLHGLALLGFVGLFLWIRYV